MVAVVQLKAFSQTVTLSVAVTMDATPTNGNYLIAAYRESQLSTVTLPAGWAWATGSPHNGGTTRASGIAYKKVAGDSATITFQSDVSDTKTLHVTEVSGLAASSVLGPHAETAQATGLTSKNTGSTGVLSQPDVFAIGCVSLSGASGGSDAVNSGFTLQAISTSTFLVGHKVTAETTALDPTFSWLTARSAKGQIATFLGSTEEPGTAGSFGDSFRESLNRIAGTSGLDERGAANVAAGTTGLDIRGALNVLAGTTGLDERGALNALAGTTGLDEQDAARRIIA